MPRSLIRRSILAGVSIAASLAVLAVSAGCGTLSGSDKDAQIAQLQQQVRASAPNIVVQTGQLQATTDRPAATGWDTPASLKAGVKLISTFDSSGTDAWDASKHPLVFVTSEGRGYAGTYSTTYTLAGLQIIDATTKQIVASAAYDLDFKLMGTPHGSAVSGFARRHVDLHSQQ
jgi:hypothetical protein